MENKKKTLPQRVKEVVDFTYEYLVQHEDGITMDAKSLFGADRGIVTVLVKRGIISKTFVAATGRRGVVCKYKWVATMPPTKTLYGSILQELRNKTEHKQSSRVIDDNTQSNETPIIVPEEKTAVTLLSGFSDQELWDELKRRGYSAEGDRLVKKAYLN